MEKMKNNSVNANVNDNEKFVRQIAYKASPLRRLYLQRIWQ